MFTILYSKIALFPEEDAVFAYDGEKWHILSATPTDFNDLLEKSDIKINQFISQRMLGATENRQDLQDIRQILDSAIILGDVMILVTDERSDIAGDLEKTYQGKAVYKYQIDDNLFLYIIVRR